MTTEQTTPSTESLATEAKKGSWKGAVWIAVTLVLLVLIAVNARAVPSRRASRNPAVTGAPRPVDRSSASPTGSSCTRSARS